MLYWKSDSEPVLRQSLEFKEVKGNYICVPFKDVRSNKIVGDSIDSQMKASRA
jgi:hypothetical protein